jgi:ArsR family transcriptional regulator
VIADDKVALALSDPIRLQILDLLAVGRDQTCCSPENPDAPIALCSCDILSVLDLAPSRLSYHMKELREAGLITEQKRGRWVYFSLNRSAVADFTKSLYDRFVVEKERPQVACCSEPLFQLDTTSVSVDDLAKDVK